MLKPEHIEERTQKINIQSASKSFQAGSSHILTPVVVNDNLTCFKNPDSA